jgi:Tol biopolymer transport system component
MTPRRTGLLTLLICCWLAASAQASNVVFVCGKDLCSAASDGSARLRLTGDGAKGGYTSPSVSRSGKRIAYTRGKRGRVFTARLVRRGGRIRGLSGIRRIPPFRDGARDATQFDVALSKDGSEVAWVELRINVVFDTVDYRRYVARFDGSRARQVAASGGRPFVAWGSGSQTLREGLTIETDAQQTGESVDSGLCTASPDSAQNGTCRGPGARQLAFDPSGRHLRHPDVFGNRLVATAYAFGAGEPDNATQKPGSIVLFDAATSRPVRDLTSATTDSSPVFSPDGRRVAFERRGSVFTVRVSGGAARRLLRRAREPSWSR